MPDPIPYQIAVLCYLFDDQGRLLLLHRRKAPNRNLYSPVGGKLDRAVGESPLACAIREIAEETDVNIDRSRLHLTGIVTETAYESASHWMMFLYEVTGPVHVTRTSFDEGRLEWHPMDRVLDLEIPETDRRVIWPLFCKYRRRFFAAHIDCMDGQINWTLDQPVEDAAGQDRD